MNMDKFNYLTTVEAGAELDYTRQHIGHLVRTGELVGERMGRDILVSKKSVDAYKKKYKGHRTPGRKSQIVSAHSKSFAIAE